MGETKRGESPSIPLTEKEVSNQTVQSEGETQKKGKNHKSKGVSLGVEISVTSSSIVSLETVTSGMWVEE